MSGPLATRDLVSDEEGGRRSWKETRSLAGNHEFLSIDCERVVMCRKVYIREARGFLLGLVHSRSLFEKRSRLLNHRQNEESSGNTFIPLTSN